MTASEPLSVADRFALILAGLCGAIAARIAGRALDAAMIVIIWRRVKRIERQVQALLARFLSGRLVVRSGTRVGGGVGAGHTPAQDALPRGFAWLIPLVPQWAAGYASQLRVVLAEPEMVALLAAAPQAQRLLAPLCRMLGLEPALLGPRHARRAGVGPRLMRPVGVPDAVAAAEGPCDGSADLAGPRDGPPCAAQRLEASARPGAAAPPAGAGFRRGAPATAPPETRG